MTNCGVKRRPSGAHDHFDWWLDDIAERSDWRG